MNSREQKELVATIDALKARGDGLTRQLVQENQRVKHLKVSLENVNKEIVVTREANKNKAVALLNLHTSSCKEAYQRADGINPTLLAERNQKKLLKNLECQLNKALIQKDKIKIDNDHIMEEIVKLRLRIQNSHAAREGMQDELRSIQQKINEIYAQASHHAKQRDKTVERRNQLISENEDEKVAFSAEVSRLGSLVTKHAELLTETIASTANVVSATLNLAETDDRTVTSADDVNDLDRMLNNLDKQTLGKSKELRQIESKIRDFETQYKLVQDLMSLPSINDAINVFVVNEEQSFGQLKHIQAVNQEADEIFERLAGLEDTVDSCKRKHEQKESETAAVVSAAEEKLRREHANKEKVTCATREGMDALNEIDKKVDAINKKLQRREAIKEASGGDSQPGITSVSKQEPEEPALACYDEVLQQSTLATMKLIESNVISLINDFARKLARENEIRAKVTATMSPRSHFKSPAEESAKKNLARSGSPDFTESARILSLTEIRQKVEDRLVE